MMWIGWMTGLALAQVDIREVPMTGTDRTTISQVVLHATGGFACDPAVAFHSGTLNGHVRWFQDRTDGVSIHYIVGRDGEIVRMVPESQVANHVAGHNTDSIGIELINDGNGRDVYEAAQITALQALLADILTRNNLATEAITTHSALDQRRIDCAQEPDGSWRTTITATGAHRRRTDPGAAFPLADVVSEVQSVL